MSAILSNSSTIITSGTSVTALDSTINGSTIDIAGLGAAAALEFTGDAGINAANPSVDATSVIASAVPGQTGAGATEVETSGEFVNKGTILADGPAGSTFTVTVASAGTSAVPSYFYNAGTARYVDDGEVMAVA